MTVSAGQLLVLQNLSGVGRKTIFNLLGAFGEVSSEVPQEREGFLELLREVEDRVTRFRAPTAPAFDSAVHMAAAVRQDAKEAGVHIIPFTHRAYPERLLRTPDPPPLLYVKGEIGALHHAVAVAVVGTREPSMQGGDWAQRTGALLASDGYVVVSGLAKGCDTRAHEGCAEENGVGVAVLAHGLHYVYPKENVSLAERLLDLGGCLVSEYPPGKKAMRSTFVERDRLQSGLSDLLLVAETGIKGGTMHTVRFAREQGRPVACYYSSSEQWRNWGKSQGNISLVEGGSAMAIEDLDQLKEFTTQLKDGNRHTDGPRRSYVSDGSEDERAFSDKLTPPIAATGVQEAEERWDDLRRNSGDQTNLFA